MFELHSSVIGRLLTNTMRILSAGRGRAAQLDNLQKNNNLVFRIKTTHKHRQTSQDEPLARAVNHECNWPRIALTPVHQIARSRVWTVFQRYSWCSSWSSQSPLTLTPQLQGHKSSLGVDQQPEYLLVPLGCVQCNNRQKLRESGLMESKMKV